MPQPNPEGGDDQFEQTFGCSLETMKKAIARNGKRRHEYVYLGRAESDGGKEYLKEKKLQIITAGDLLLRSFGVEMDRWERAITRVDDHVMVPFDVAAAERFRKNGIGPTKTLWQLAYDRLPIEDDADGDTHVEVDFRGTDTVVNVRVFGDFWIEHQYKDPKTSKLVWYADAAESSREIMDSEEIDPVRSDVEFILNAEAYISDAAS